MHTGQCWRRHHLGTIMQGFSLLQGAYAVAVNAAAMSTPASCIATAVPCQVLAARRLSEHMLLYLIIPVHPFPPSFGRPCTFGSQGSRHHAALYHMRMHCSHAETATRTGTPENGKPPVLKLETPFFSTKASDGFGRRAPWSAVSTQCLVAHAAHALIIL